VARVLVVDDEPAVRRALERALRLDNYEVELASDGEEALDALTRTPADAVILDILMPRLDGLEVARRMRKAGDRTPILMLTARDAVEDRVAGLDSGADDYLVKPFAFEELLARLRVVLRRRNDAAAMQLRVDDLQLDLVRHEVRRGKRDVPLTAREFALLEFMMRHPGHALSRDQLVQAVWPRDFEGGSNVVDTYIHYLRDKVDRAPAKPLIRTVRGVGYALGR
jgi:two-component system response regulator MprA